MRRKILIAILAVPALVLLAGLLYLKFGDLGRFRGTIERRTSEVLGRDLTIAGEFDLDVLFTPRLVAEEVTLDGVWFSFPDLRRRLVPAKGGFLLPRSDSACRELENGQTLLEVNIAGGDALPATTTFEMDPEFVKDALMSCRREGRFTRSEARPRFGR